MMILARNKVILLILLIHILPSCRYFKETNPEPDIIRADTLNEKPAEPVIGDTPQAWDQHAGDKPGTYEFRFRF
jgi:hypothetical protein